MKRKALFRHISVVLLICLFLNSYIIPVSSEETIEVGQSTIVNGSFEYPYLRENDIKDKKYYSYGENKNEQAAKAYWSNIKKKQ